MVVSVGTSGYNYPEWKGTFYPEKLPASRMFAFYAERFRTVEINYTFYRMPTPKLAEGWRDHPKFHGTRYNLRQPRHTVGPSVPRRGRGLPVLLGEVVCVDVDSTHWP